MSFIVLAFLACLGGDPAGKCRTVELPWMGDLQQCGLFGQAMIAQWESQHPDWRSQGRYTCGPLRRTA